MEVETGGRHGRPQQVTGLSLREEPELGTALGALAGRHVRELRTWTESVKLPIWAQRREQQ
ncbi:hypothetical protein FAF44_49110 [Nonomuraea sp. MG754425]|uniref:hypothetical protein n=1 Tax=Nonomuraea sp. MG754425 TaxID=2570319 RepID=UPI001F164D9B|nr:hypothetical protein [Nonomuraea sp. MG754425]MCF6476251.1 hypothetical protein [Nonomuraea sp. MG754425]